MAAESNSRHNKSSTIAFTLPISCQVCLGKVKNPVLCPNSHVFCANCMDVWLQRNQKCPACRVSMTSSKKILGGLNPQEDDSDKLTNPDLRKARFDLLYKEYENEFERLQSEVTLLRTENEILKQQSRSSSAPTGSQYSTDTSRSSDNANLLALTKKLQDATKQYDKVKTELSRLKQENSHLKDENVSLNRENQNLRAELTGRSPHRYGRITVSTLETKVAEYEKDIARLNKALERSDKYIEELQTELQMNEKKTSAKRGEKQSYSNSEFSSKALRETGVTQSEEFDNRVDSHRRKLFKQDKPLATAGENKYYYNRNGAGKEKDMHDDYEEFTLDRSGQAKSDCRSVSKGTKRVTFDLTRETNETTFDLEMPSPVKMSGNRNGASNRPGSPVKGVLKNGKKQSDKGASENSLELSMSRSYDNFSMDSSKSHTVHGDDDTLSTSSSKPSRQYSKDDDYLYTKSRSTYSSRHQEDNDIKLKHSADDSALSIPSDSETVRPSRRRTYQKEDMDDTQLIESELDDLNISLTPEFTDCMKLLNRAEKNVHKHADSDDEQKLDYKFKEDKFDYKINSKDSNVGSSASSRRRGLDDADYDSGLKVGQTGTSVYRSSLDSYSRGRHIRSGSLDNLLMDSVSSTARERPSSEFAASTHSFAPPAASSDVRSRYGNGVVGGMIGRSPSVDNLLLSQRPPSLTSRFSSGDNESTGYRTRLSLPGYASSRPYIGEKPDDKIAVDGVGGEVAGNRVTDGFVGRDSVQSTRRETPGGHTRSYSDLGTSVTSLTARQGLELERKSGAQLTTDYTGSRNQQSDSSSLPGTTNLTALRNLQSHDKLDWKSLDGRQTPTHVPSNADSVSHSILPIIKRYEYNSTGVGNVSQKPPIAGRVYDSWSAAHLPSSVTPVTYTNSSSSSSVSHIPAYCSASSYHSGSLPSSSTTSYTGNQELVQGTAVTGADGGSIYSKFDVVSTLPSRPRIDTVSGSGYDFVKSDLAHLSSRPHIATDPLISTISSKGTHKIEYSDKPDYLTRSDDNVNSVSSAKVNFASALSSIPGSSTSSSSSISSSVGLGYDPMRSSSYATTVSYLTSMTGSSSSSCSTTHTVPLTHVSTAFPSARPAHTLEPIVESNHYSYVSNISGDFPSKQSNDTFALPEPKKRLFENSDDLDMSVSPIKSNRRY